ncbi:MAG: hypothetical protein AB2761_20935 [Candidatus Thiodiazotropha endolucinida]
MENYQVISTILAALRHFQNESNEIGIENLIARYPHFDDVDPLTDAELEELCELLNTGAIQLDLPSPKWQLFKDLNQACAYIAFEFISTLKDDLRRMEIEEAEHYTDYDREMMRLRIADLNQVMPIIQQLPELLKEINDVNRLISDATMPDVRHGLTDRSDD